MAMIRRGLPILGLALAGLLAGCASYAEQTDGARRAFAQLAFDAAAARLKGGAESAGRDQLCYLLERGVVRQAAGQYAESAADLLAADKLIAYYEEKAVISASDTAAAAMGLVINDRLAPYRGEGYEKILLHAYLVVDFLMRGDLDGARVEARRAYAAQRREAEAHERALRRADAAADRKAINEAAALRAARERYRDQEALLRRAGNLYQNGFAYYLSALVYELHGEINDAYVDLKALQQINPGFTPAHRALLDFSRRLGFDDDQRRWEALYPAAARALAAERAPAAPPAGEVVVLFGCGEAPVKEEIKLRLPLKRGYATVAFPRYRTQTNPVARAALRLGGERLAETEPLCDVEATAVKHLWDQLPLIVIRALIRATAKAAVVNELSRQAGKNQGEGAEVAAALVGSLLADVTEQADLRSWTLLPASLQAARVGLPAGRATLDLDLLNASGARVGGIRVPVEVRPGGVTLVTVRSVGFLAAAGARTVK